MKFYKQPLAVGQQKLTDSLLHALKADKTVLWLLSGGSNITISTEIMKLLHGHERKLIISLIDERYGVVGHKDSNWQQLIGSGFDGGNATMYPVLQHGLSMAATARMFELTLQDSLDKADLVIGQLGMGPDGHVSGILPHSVATEPTKALIVSYETEQYGRITTTFSALQQLNTAFCFIYGDDKKSALTALRDQKLSLQDQPAQILKDLRQAYVYNDQLED